MWGNETVGERYKDPTGALLGYVRHTATTLNLLDKNIKTECNKTKIEKKTPRNQYCTSHDKTLFLSIFTLIIGSEQFSTLN